MRILVATLLLYFSHNAFGDFLDINSAFFEGDKNGSCFNQPSGTLTTSKSITTYFCDYDSDTSYTFELEMEHSIGTNPFDTSLTIVDFEFTALQDVYWTMSGEYSAFNTRRGFYGVGRFRVRR